MGSAERAAFYRPDVDNGTGVSKSEAKTLAAQAVDANALCSPITY